MTSVLTEWFGNKFPQLLKAGGTLLVMLKKHHKLEYKTFEYIIFLFILSTFVESCSDSKLIEITQKEAFNIEVKKKESSRGLLIINEKYLLNNNNVEIIRGIDKLGVTDESIWRLNKSKPSLLKIPTPFRLIKKENNDSISIIFEKDTIIAKIQ